ncbi:TMEM175 family protein [Arthrobacter sp. efr-133-R2A-63]|uniref:TMEM175 family protein n=1 Tax=Arthrobacter sp. efr-133-R2A-63 TaxID=3040278 RepID=UPI00254E8880|nr:TMEM175 family protein [Arthrobacter sp. efr-133-R2A-63]
MQTTRGLDRLVFFTDAVTAIAITLLVLPLVDSVTQAAHDGLSAEQFIGNNYAAVSGFALSFVVIARLWLAHHSTFEHVRSYSSPLLLLNLFWAFTVVVLPLPTEMVSQFRTSPLSVGVYIGTMAASSLTLTAMTLLIRKHPQLEMEENPMPGREVFSSVVSTIGFFIALIVGVLVPAINFYALLIILLTVPLQRVYDRRSAAARLAPAAQSS